jgi:hypothetical protein
MLERLMSPLVKAAELANADDDRDGGADLKRIGGDDSKLRRSDAMNSAQTTGLAGGIWCSLMSIPSALHSQLKWLKHLSAS